MGYSIDLSRISIDRYMKKLKNKNLIPSRMILKDKIEQRFSVFKKNGTKTAYDLYSALKNSKRFNELSGKKELPEDYLKILLTELKSIQAKPIKLTEFEWISAELIKKLSEAGIKNTKQLYEHALKNTAELTCKANKNELQELVKQCDLTRIQWVNSTFAHVLYEAGYDNVNKVASADHETLYRKITEINKDNRYYKGKIGLNDIKICIEAAGEVEQEIKY
jgi:hypothetical protein